MTLNWLLPFGRFVHHPLVLLRRLTMAQIMLSTSDTDYMDQLIPIIKDACVQRREDALMVQLNRFSDEKEAEVERVCNANHQSFVQSVDQVLHVRVDTVRLTSEILDLNQSIHRSTQN